MVLVQKTIKKIYLYKEWEWRQPNENTILYMPLNSDTTYLDQVWLITTNNWVVFWTYAWVDCWFFNRNYITISSLPFANTTTFNWRQYDISWEGFPNSLSDWSKTWYSYHFKMWITNNTTVSVEWCNNATQTASNPVSGLLASWHNVVVLFNYTEWYLSVYIDWNLYYSGTSSNMRNPSERQWTRYLWWDCYSWTSQTTDRRTYSYMSNWIIENKIWTTDEILDYYDQTKEIYWL